MKRYGLFVSYSIDRRIMCAWHNYDNIWSRLWRRYHTNENSHATNPHNRIWTNNNHANTNAFKKDKAILTNSILGASVGLLLNICLVKHLQSVGSAIVWVCSEFTVLLMAQYYVKNTKALLSHFPVHKIPNMYITGNPYIYNWYIYNVGHIHYS